MSALYDYNPEEQSPKDNPDSELAFKKGQVIIIYGDMVLCYLVLLLSLSFARLVYLFFYFFSCVLMVFRAH